MTFKSVKTISVEMVKKVTNQVTTVEDKDLLWLPKTVFSDIRINQSEQNDYKKFLVMFYAGRWVNGNAILNELNEKMEAYFNKEGFFKMCKNSCTGYLSLHFNHNVEYWPGEPEVEIEVLIREVGEKYIISAKRITKEIKVEYKKLF